MNSDENRWLTKRILIIVAFPSLICAAGILIFCARPKVHEAILLDENTASLQAIKGILQMNRAAYSLHGLLPLMSVLIIINAILLLACCRKFYRSDK
jgi:hypothetical protein